MMGSLFRRFVEPREIKRIGKFAILVSNEGHPIYRIIRGTTLSAYQADLRSLNGIISDLEELKTKDELRDMSAIL